MRPLAWLLARGDDPGEPAHAAEIRAELEHHLACARAELERAGLTPAAAAAEAERRFGARTRIAAECLAVHGGIPMLNRLHAIVTAVLLLSTLSLAYFLHQASTAAGEAQAAARQAVQVAEATREQAVLTSRIHPVWREELVRRLLDRMEGVTPPTPQEKELLRALGYSEHEK